MNSKNSLQIAIFAVAALLSLGASAEQSFSSLEERMTGQEFRETGLHKLSDDELAALNRWIRQRSLAEGEAWTGDGEQGSATPEGDRRGLRAESRTDRSAIRSRLVGSFSGWRGNDVFELENGQVWRQSEPGTFAVSPMENPEVEITPGMFSGWFLRVDGYNTRVRVERVR